jgi:SAM-dependent methyltransferase
MSFETLVQQAWEHGIQGWDWSFLEGRMSTTPLSWDYTALARQRMAEARAMLDIGTGGGELFSGLGPYPPLTVATEAYPPSADLAGRTLRAVGVPVVQTEDDIRVALPFATQSLDLVINRHAGYSPTELFRILKSGGRFLTQQVGGKNQFRLNEIFQDEPHFIYGFWTLDYALQELQQAGFEILLQREETPETRFFDIGAVVYFLKIIDWQVPGFSPHRDWEKLQQVHQRIQEVGFLQTWQHNFIISAVKSL